MVLAMLWLVRGTLLVAVIALLVAMARLRGTRLGSAIVDFGQVDSYADCCHRPSKRQTFAIFCSDAAAMSALCQKRA